MELAQRTLGSPLFFFGFRLVVRWLEPVNPEAFEDGKIPVSANGVDVDTRSVTKPELVEVTSDAAPTSGRLPDVQTSILGPERIDASFVSYFRLVPFLEVPLLGVPAPPFRFPVVPSVPILHPVRKLRAGETLGKSIGGNFLKSLDGLVYRFAREFCRRTRASRKTVAQPVRPPLVESVQFPPEVGLFRQDNPLIPRRLLALSLRRLAGSGPVRPAASGLTCPRGNVLGRRVPRPAHFRRKERGQAVYAQSAQIRHSLHKSHRDCVVTLLPVCPL